LLSHRFQAEDVEKLKQENGQLRMKIQKLTREIDLANDGQSEFCSFLRPNQLGDELTRVESFMANSAVHRWR